MLRTLTANLSPEERQRLHPDFLANEQGYLRLRPALLQTHHGLWAAVDGDKVVAAGPELIRVSELAAACPHAYLARVGKEGTTIFRVRNQSMAVAP